MWLGGLVAALVVAAAPADAGAPGRPAYLPGNVAPAADLRPATLTS